MQTILPWSCTDSSVPYRGYLTKSLERCIALIEVIEGLVGKPHSVVLNVKRHKQRLEHDVAEDGYVEVLSALHATPAVIRVVVDGAVVEVPPWDGDYMVLVVAGFVWKFEQEVRKALGLVARESKGVSEARIHAHARHVVPVQAGEVGRHEHERGACVNCGLKLVLPPDTTTASPSRKVKGDVPVGAVWVGFHPGDVT